MQDAGPRISHQAIQFQARASALGYAPGALTSWYDMTFRCPPPMIIRFSQLRHPPTFVRPRGWLAGGIMVGKKDHELYFSLVMRPPKLTTGTYVFTQGKGALDKKTPKNPQGSSQGGFPRPGRWAHAERQRADVVPRNRHRQTKILDEGTTTPDRQSKSPQQPCPPPSPNTPLPIFGAPFARQRLGVTINPDQEAAPYFSEHRSDHQPRAQ